MISHPALHFIAAIRAEYSMNVKAGAASYLNREWRPSTRCITIETSANERALSMIEGGIEVEQKAERSGKGKALSDQTGPDCSIFTWYHWTHSTKGRYSSTDQSVDQSIKRKKKRTVPVQYVSVHGSWYASTNLTPKC